MSLVNPLPKEKTASELHPIYDGLSKKFGKMPNIFGQVPPLLLRRHGRRHRGSALQRASLSKDSADQRLRVLNPRSHRFGEADWYHRRTDSSSAILRAQLTLQRKREGHDSLRRAGHPRRCRDPRRFA